MPKPDWKLVLTFLAPFYFGVKRMFIAKKGMGKK